MTAVSSFAMNDTHDYYSPIFYMDPEKNKLYCSYAAAIDVISTQSMRKTGSIFIGGLNGLSQDFVISPSGNISYAITIDDYPIETPVESNLVVINNESLSLINIYRLSSGTIAKQRNSKAGRTMALSMHSQGLYVVVGGNTNKNDILRIDIDDI